MKKMFTILIGMIVASVVLLLDMCLGGLLIWGICNLSVNVFNLNLSCTYIQAILIYFILEFFIFLIKK